MYRIRLSLIPTVVLLCLPLCDARLIPPVFAQVSNCDPNLVQPENVPLGYRLRGDRCEGLYIKEVSSTILVVASLTESFEDYDLTSDKHLVVEWKSPQNVNVRLRAQGLRRRLYYRMDTMCPVGSTSYTWPLNILSALEISKRDLGVVGWTRYNVGLTERDVYVPLRLSQKGNPSRSGSYRIVLLPGVELTEVFITLAIVGGDGRPRTFLKSGEALKYGYYPAERGIVIPLSDLNAPGLYYLQIGATLRLGGSSTVELWIYHTGG